MQLQEFSWMLDSDGAQMLFADRGEDICVPSFIWRGWEYWQRKYAGLRWNEVVKQAVFRGDSKKFERFVKKCKKGVDEV